MELKGKKMAAFLQFIWICLMDNLLTNIHATRTIFEWGGGDLRSIRSKNCQPPAWFVPLFVIGHSSVLKSKAANKILLETNFFLLHSIIDFINRWTSSAVLPYLSENSLKHWTAGVGLQSLLPCYRKTHAPL